MPSDEVLLQQAEDWKTKGNEAFAQGATEDAIAAYSQGVVACDRIVPVPAALKATLLSNRAMCRLKTMHLRDCIEDCSTALQLDLSDANVRVKLWYRRARARVLLANLTGAGADHNEMLQDAAKDLLSALQADPKNADANKLLMMVRTQLKTTQTAATPLSMTLQKLQKGHDNAVHNVKILIGILDNDITNGSMELGRLEGVSTMLELATAPHDDDGPKLAVLALQVLSQAGSHPAFCRAYLVDRQSDLATIITTANTVDVVVSSLAVYLRVLLHADRDDPTQDIVGTTLIDSNMLATSCTSALRRFEDRTVIRAVLDVISTFTAGVDREAMIRASLSGHHSSSDPLLPTPQTQAEIRGMTPQELAAHRKREYDKKTRDQAWAFERARWLCTGAPMQAFLTAATRCADHVVRREMTVVLGRLLAALEDEDQIKATVVAFLSNVSDVDNEPKIVEVYNEDEEKEAVDEDTIPLETKMERALITTALLLSKKDIGAWALGSGGWKNAADELPELIRSENSRAMCLAAEVMSGAATVEATRHLVANMAKSGDMERLLMSDDRDIRSGAASAIAKLGLGDKATDEAEIMGLLQAAADLLEDTTSSEDEPAASKDAGKLKHFSSFAGSSVERAIEILNYLIANTFVKDEIAAGFQTAMPAAQFTVLERLVKVATEIPNAGESLSGFGLATIFQYMAVTNMKLREEGFEGKEVTMEQYDEMSRLGKTEEEKEVMDAQKDTDTQAACDERIRHMASANVPRALIALIEGASEHTLEQIVLALNRMATEPSVRGVMIQQGVLSNCIKVEKSEGPTETETMKKTIRMSRHCIAKMLITTNPTLLTSTQRLGAIKPLINLVRDNKATDLQQFEALLALTNVASSGEDAKTRIISEKGISSLHFAMFSDHPMVRRAATEAMCNLVPHKAMMDHLAEAEHLKLWLAFADDYEENYECARAAAGCLAMATQDESIALELIGLEKFQVELTEILESGRLEIMHRAMVIVLNLAMHGGDARAKIESDGLVAFCKAYVDMYNSGKSPDLQFSDEEKALLPVTVDLAKKVVQVVEAQ